MVAKFAHKDGRKICAKWIASDAEPQLIAEAIAAFYQNKYRRTRAGLQATIWQSNTKMCLRYVSAGMVL